MWIVYSLGTAICWALGYVLTERVLKSGISPSVLMIFSGATYFFISCAMVYWKGNLSSNIDIIKDNHNLIYDIAIISVTLFLGILFINIAIGMKNATLVNLIEISYPVFTLIFAYFILKEFQLSLTTGIGAILIIAGVFIIILKG